uniref:SAM domain-containing protein n=1 Tax=Musca domestica TaxID=7370 RepID=A0A1I8M736_MUSDO
MRYLYKESDEKYVKPKERDSNRLPNPLSEYKFRLDTITRGRFEFDKNDMPIVFKCSPDTLLNICIKIVDEMPLPSVYEWNIEDICKWLRGYGYRQYQNTFRENLINGHTLLLLDASALSAMNIKDFEHIKHIAYGIRSLFYFEMTKFGRSLSQYPEFHNEVYKLIQTKTGRAYKSTRRSDLWRRLQIIRKREPNHLHWDLLEKWLNFEKVPEHTELFGGVHRYDLYRCHGKPRPQEIEKPSKICPCLPPCECGWANEDYRQPWTLQCLPHLRDKYKGCVKSCKNCMAPCTCRWSSKMYQTRGVLSCLQIAFPQKYGSTIGVTQFRQRSQRAVNDFQNYRLSSL